MNTSHVFGADWRKEIPQAFLKKEKLCRSHSLAFNHLQKYTAGDALTVQDDDGGEGKIKLP